MFLYSCGTYKISYKSSETSKASKFAILKLHNHIKFMNFKVYYNDPVDTNVFRIVYIDGGKVNIEGRAKIYLSLGEHEILMENTYYIAVRDSKRPGS